jgi:hypothetical protein
MKIWVFSDPANYENYARATRYDMWSNLHVDHNGNVEPLIMEWEPDSNCVGDFTWPALDKDIVVTENTGKALLQRFKGIVLGPVEMIQNIQPEIIEKEKKKGIKRIILPYTGPKLYNMYVSNWVDIDFEKSSYSIELDDNGNEIYNIEGIERIEAKYDRLEKKITKQRINRDQSKGIFINYVDLSGVEIFRINQAPASVFCTDNVKVFIEARNYSNVQFLEVGDMLEGQWGRP